MSANHTPFPARLIGDEAHEYLADESGVLRVSCVGENTSIGDDCRLAAEVARRYNTQPDLLAACERVDRWLEQNSVPEIQGVWCDIIAAIRKARSES